MVQTEGLHGGKSRWIMSSNEQSEHTCEPNEEEIIAALFKESLKELVRNDPARAIQRAISTVKTEIEEKYGENEEKYNKIISELGNDKGLADMLYNVRVETVGETPKTRNEFKPEAFLDKHFKKDNIILKDSDLKDNWEEQLKKTNVKTKYCWKRKTEEMRDHEVHEERYDEVDEQEECEEWSQGRVHECPQDEDNSDEDKDEQPQNKETPEELNPNDQTKTNKNKTPKEPNSTNQNKSNKKKPKRVLMYTTKKLLTQLAKNLKTSVDGTFKSCCQLWGQSFIWMVKQRGYWVPVCWGWLPDKSEVSYKVFLLLVIEAMTELCMKLNIESVSSDFELNIMKALDDILEVDILGCFFHLKKVFKTKVDKHGFKTRYSKDSYFKSFINVCGSIAHLPVEDINDALKNIEECYQFEDEKATTFKSYFLKYIQDYWVDGCYPPSTWNCFQRSQDATNNNLVNFVCLANA